MKKLTIAAVAFVAVTGAALAQTNQHSDHSPVAPSAALAAGGMTGKMMQNMPEQCRSAMQAMPANCTDMMQQMMGVGATATNANMPAHARENAVAMDKMHGPMMKGGSVADADEAFVRGMIPHHQGAIDMAQVVLKYAKDDQVKKWANDVIREQTREIKEMEAWLQQRGM